tara:strand:+ start:263 stop:709 length:447 start_codon:yes stop_codon:yes gene_type:complete
LDKFTNKREWNLTKTILPQHTDHVGVMWHGAYFNFLEEARIDALKNVGIKYSTLSKKGYEIPVVSAQIKYKISFINGEKIILKSKFNIISKLKLNCKTLFLKVNGDIGAEALIELVLVRKEKDSIRLVREVPPEIKKVFFLLEEGPKI